MTDRLQRATTRLAVRRKAHMGRTVTYRRGDDSVELQATIGETIFRLVGAYGSQTRVVRRDYLIEAADLVLDGSAVQPRAGDRIEETDDDGTWVHEVGAPGGEPAWRWSGPHRGTYRTHTQLVTRP